MTSTPSETLWSALIQGHHTSSSSSSSSWLLSLKDPAPINWCEHDYVMVPWIAEFWNTISNLGFIFSGFYGFYHTIKHRSQLGSTYRYFLGLSSAILLTGITSALFHATLWWIGQKTDEMFENLILIHLYWIGSSRTLLYIVHCIFTSIGILSITSFLFCELHFILMVISTLRTMHQHVQTYHVIRWHLVKAVIFSVFGFSCWLVDRLACHNISQLWQLHAWWHIMMSCACHQAFICTEAIQLYRQHQQVELYEQGGLTFLNVKSHDKKQ